MSKALGFQFLSTTKCLQILLQGRGSTRDSFKRKISASV